MTNQDVRAKKVAVVDEVKRTLDESAAVVLTEYRGLSVRQLEALRAALRPSGATYTVYKNTLVRFAARDAGLEMDDLLTGPTAMAATGAGTADAPADPVALAKALVDFAKANDKLVIKGGILDGQLLDATQVGDLAKIAPREELLARLAGLMAAPMQQFAALLNAVPAKFAYALQALIDAGGAPGAPAAPPADASDGVADDAAADDGDSDTPAVATDETPTVDDSAETPSDADGDSDNTATEEE